MASYPAVDPRRFYEDEEELLRRAGYSAAAEIPAEVPPVAAPAADAVAPAMGSLEDMEARAAKVPVDMGLAVRSAMETPAGQRPQWKDYAPAEPHGWSKFGHIMAGLTGPTNYWLNVRPQKNAESKYRNALADYAAPQQEAAQQAEIDKNQAAAERDRSAEGSRQPAAEHWDIVPGFVGPNGEPLQVEQRSGQARFANLPGVQVKEPAKAPSDFETYYRQWLTDNKFPDTAHNRLMARAEYEKADKAVTVRGQDMTDARSREQNEIARQTKEQQRAAQDTTSLGGFSADMDRLAVAANELKNHPGLKGVTGIRGVLPNIPGGNAANAEAKFNTLKSQIAFSVLQTLRNNAKTGGALGQVSDKEEQMLTANLAALDKSQSLEEIQNSLQQIIDYTVAAKDRASAAFANQHPEADEGGGEEGGEKKVEYKPGLIRNGYRFKGGDPTKRENWEPVKKKAK